MRRLFSYFQLLPIRYIFGLICAVLVSSISVFLICQYQNQTLRLRNKFLEQRYVEQMKQGGAEPRPTVVSQADQEKWEHIYESRDGKFLNKVYSFPGDYGLDVETIDLDTHQVIARHSENSYFNFLKRLEGMFTNNLRTVFLKTEGNKQYMVLDSFIGNIKADSISEIYVASLSPNDEVISVKSFFVQPLSLKSIVMMSTYTKNEILDYYPQRNQLLIKTSSGDGCGGMGSVKLVSAGAVSQTIKEIGVGCRLQTRYLGYLGGILYFGDINLTGDGAENWEEAKIVTIYSLNPLTKERKNLKVDLANYVFDTTWVDVVDKISATELVLFEKTTEEGYALDVKTLGLRNMGRLYD